MDDTTRHICMPFDDGLRLGACVPIRRGGRPCIRSGMVLRFGTGYWIQLDAPFLYCHVWGLVVLLVVITLLPV